MNHLSYLVPRVVQRTVPNIFKRNISTTSLRLGRKEDGTYEEIYGPPKEEGPGRAWKVLKDDFKHTFIPGTPHPLEFSTFCDVLILGGGVMGSSIAYFLKENMAYESMRVCVVEKDSSYTRSSTVLSVGGIRQQFSLPENIEMSMFGAEFLRTAKRRLEVYGSPGPDMHFHPQGYLFLASEAGAQQMLESHKVQMSLGAKVRLLTPEQIKLNYPWINTDGIAMGSHGTENEGWFDPWSLLYGLKRKAISNNVEYINAEVVGFDFYKNPCMLSAGEEHEGEFERVERCVVKTPDGRLKGIQFAHCIIAAGHNSGKIAEMARIGRGEKLLSVPLPVEPRKRFVYYFHAPDEDGPSLDSPLVIDPSGAYFRREGLANHFIGGQSPPFEDEPSPENLEVDYEYFDNVVWPNLANRVPAFNNIKVKSAWAGYYDYNTFDQNAIIGNHPYHNNLHFATGFSGHGIQQAPAVGRAMAELILDGHFTTIDLSRFAFERFIVGKEVREEAIV